MTRIPRRLRTAIRCVRDVAATYQSVSCLRAEADRLRDEVVPRAQKTASGEDRMTRRLALATEALRRALGVDLYDTQVTAGLLLSSRGRGQRGRVAEMATGEGKTFAAFLPTVAAALNGRGVHVVTSNAYLATRDAELLRPAYELLGLTVAPLPEGHDADKSGAYAADVTHGTGYEFGFDYLRDRVTAVQTAGRQRFAERSTARPSPPVQRLLRFAIIDEVDHVLLDDACSPLVLAASSGAAASDAAAHAAARQLALSLETSVHTTTRGGGINLTPAGQDAAYDALTGEIAGVLLRPWTEYVEKALHAEFVLRRDVHYVLEKEDVRIVDQSTGRIFEDRTWSEGLHQAVEAKEGLPVREAQRTLARVTRQRFYGLYESICGLSGTASDGWRECRTVYGVDVAVVPRHRPCRRSIGPVEGFGPSAARWDAVADEVVRLRETGRPVLVGTASIASSLEISERLQDRGVDHTLLNGRQDAEEARVVSAAGRRGAVTVATNLAGRGTDIRLEEGVAEQGGLHVVAAETQPGARVLRQLMGRAARQGDPGSVSRYVSAEDANLLSTAPWLCEQLRRSAGPCGRVRGDLTSICNRVLRANDRAAARGRIALWKRDRDRDSLVERIAAAPT